MARNQKSGVLKNVCETGVVSFSFGICPWKRDRMQRIAPPRIGPETMAQARSVVRGPNLVKMEENKGDRTAAAILVALKL